MQRTASYLEWLGGVWVGEVGSPADADSGAAAC